MAKNSSTELVASMLRIQVWTITSVPVDLWHTSMGEKLRNFYLINTRVVARYGGVVKVARVPLDVEPRYSQSRSRRNQPKENA